MCMWMWQQPDRYYACNKERFSITLTYLVIKVFLKVTKAGTILSLLDKNLTSCAPVYWKSGSTIDWKHTKSVNTNDNHHLNITQNP